MLLTSIRKHIIRSVIAKVAVIVVVEDIEVELVVVVGTIIPNLISISHQKTGTLNRGK